MRIPLPSPLEIEGLLHTALSAVITDKGMPWRQLALEMDGRSCSEVTQIARNAAKHAVLEGRKKVTGADMRFALGEIHERHHDRNHILIPIMRVLAIDPAVRNTGYAVLEGDPRKPTVLAFDVISIPKNIPQSAALSAIRTHLVNLITKFQPDEIAVEGIIYVQSHQTAITMGAARAAALIAAADHGLRVYEYAPRKVKSAVVGNGNADKSQVAFMVRVLLGLAETPPPDAADALAIAIAHLQASDPLKAKLLDRRLV